MVKGAGSKRSKYRTEEEKMVKEKERRNANNQSCRLHITSSISIIRLPLIQQDRNIHADTQKLWLVFVCA